jgi:hypothetical protein
MRTRGGSGYCPIDTKEGRVNADQDKSTTSRGSHALPDDADGPHPLVDLSRDPTPGKADHAKPDDDE